MKYLMLVIWGCFAFLTALSQPAFKGGQYALNDFLAAKIIYPEFSRQNCISGSIRVSFRLDKAGVVQDAKVQQGLGIDLDDEALRVVKLTSGKWTIPADYDTSTQIVLPVNFTPDQTRCAGIRSQDMTLAIQEYKNRQALQDVVTNYYKHKYSGKADTTAEATIISLKKQLGYDSAFIADVLDQAGDKLKQGDKAGACEMWQFIRNIGSSQADKMIAKYCK